MLCAHRIEDFASCRLACFASCRIRFLHFFHELLHFAFVFKPQFDKAVTGRIRWRVRILFGTASNPMIYSIFEFIIFGLNRNRLMRIGRNTI